MGRGVSSGDPTPPGVLRGGSLAQGQSRLGTGHSVVRPWQGGTDPWKSGGDTIAPTSCKMEATNRHPSCPTCHLSLGGPLLAMVPGWLSPSPHGPFLRSPRTLGRRPPLSVLVVPRDPPKKQGAHLWGLGAVE